MYLNLLNNEQKDLFLDVLLTLAHIDEDYSQKEKEVIIGYCNEMNISDVRDFSLNSFNETIDRLSEISNDTEKKIMILEAMGLAMADGNFDQHEKKLIKLISLCFCIDDSFMPECEDLLKNFISYQNKITKLVFK